MAVQARRRRRSEKTEPVSAILEFLGAVLVEGVAKGLFVTTADHFSSAAHDFAERAVKRGLVRRFDLVAGNEILRLLKLVSSHPAEPWRKHL